MADPNAILHLDYEEARQSLLILAEDYPEEESLFKEACKVIVKGEEIDLFCREQRVQDLYTKKEESSLTKEEQQVLLSYERDLATLQKLVAAYNEKAKRLVRGRIMRLKHQVS